MPGVGHALGSQEVTQPHTKWEPADPDFQNCVCAVPIVGFPGLRLLFKNKEAAFVRV